MVFISVVPKKGIRPIGQVITKRSAANENHQFKYVLLGKINNLLLPGSGLKCIKPNLSLSVCGKQRPFGNKLLLCNSSSN